MTTKVPNELLVGYPFQGGGAGFSIWSREMAASLDLSGFSTVDIMHWSILSDYAPQRYRQVPTDPGHDLAFTDAHGRWFEMDFTAGINVLAAGASPDAPNNTAAYNRIINSAAPNGTLVWWPDIGAKFRGHFRPASDGRYFSIDGGATNTHHSVVANRVLQMQGSMVQITTLTANASYGQTTLQMASTAGLAAGSIIMLEDDKGRGSDSTRVNQEILCIKSVDSGTVVTVHDKVRSIQDAGTRRVYLIDSISDFAVRNFHTRGHDHTLTGPAGIWLACASNFDYENCGAAWFKSTSSLSYVYDYRVDRVKTFEGDDHATIPNTDYGFSVYVGRKGKMNNVQTRKHRRGIDLHAVYDLDMIEPRTDQCRTGITLAHNMYGGGIRIFRPKTMEIPFLHGFCAGIWQGKQQIADPQNYVLRDIEIHNHESSFDGAPDAGGSADNIMRAILIESSWANLVINGVSGAFGRSATAPTDLNARLVQLNGVARGYTKISGVRTATSSQGDTRVRAAS